MSNSVHDRLGVESFVNLDDTSGIAWFFFVILRESSTPKNIFVKKWNNISEPW
jgi:hypothetical protein